MAWIQKLYETYDTCSSMRGYSSEDGKRPLLPICHITAQAHIEVTIDKDGNFKRAKVITDSHEATTIIPATEESGGKAGSKPASHPLCDRLQYLAGDFTKYGGTVTSGFAGDPEEPYRNYTNILSDWCSKFEHPKTKAILKYVKKKKLIADLVNYKILFLGSDKKFLPKKERKKNKDQKDIFDIVSDQGDAFVRWRVEIPGDPESNLSNDNTLWHSWTQYYLSTKQKEPLCYVTGENALLSTQHPKYIRAKGDGAKLISSNDTSGFTFRGRFLTDAQACGVSLEVSQKAHNALIWLVDRQGKVFWVKGDGGRSQPALTVVAWANSEKKIIKPTDSAFDIFPEFADLAADEPMTVDTAQALALKLRKKILGYSADLGETKDVQVMAMDSASKGRLAITYYRELKGSDYLGRIERWHSECAWIHNYGYSEEKHKRFSFVGAPTPIDIAEAAYGKRVDDKLKKSTVERLLPCIVDGQPIPRDIAESAIRHASNRIGMKDPKDKYENEWNKTLSIACALYRKFMYDKQKETYSMALDPNRKTRDYLYGRLLAIADRLEGHALYKAKEKRDTNAARYMQLFADHPLKTWRTIEIALSPYKARLGGAHYYLSLLDEVMSEFNPDDFDDKPLSGEFLLGYHCQRAELWPKNSGEKDEQENEQNSNSN